MSADVYNSQFDSWQGHAAATPYTPARMAVAVVPSDTLDLPNGANANPTTYYAKGLWIGVTGDVTVIMAADQSASGAGTAVTFKAVPVGPFNYQVRRVKATGTTATNIVALYDA